jgi:transcriptional regulator
LTYDPSRRILGSDGHPSDQRPHCAAARQGIARAIRQTSEDSLLVDHGSLYPALQRLEDQGWIKAKWGTSKNNRKARFYSLTAKGRKQLTSEASQWRRLVAAIGRVLGPEEAGG